MNAYVEIDEGGKYDPMNDEFIRVVDGRRLVYRKISAPQPNLPQKPLIQFYPNRFDNGLKDQETYFAA